MARIVFEIDLDTPENRSNFVNPVLQKLGFHLVAEVQRKIREMGLIDTGTFIGSIRFAMEGDNLIIMDGVEYGKFLEFGTSKMQAFAPMRKGIDVGLKTFQE